MIHMQIVNSFEKDVNQNYLNLCILYHRERNGSFQNNLEVTVFHTLPFAKCNPSSTLKVHVHKEQSMCACQF